ncbi:MAG: efflux RND transporter permease subunit [Hyphomicrobiaceae bacterium]|nr:efflux RND transporter permease subunit [Hyphomicrobiaceae bacterium]
MQLSDVSVKRPVFAAVMGLLLIAFGLVAFTRLPLRQYPDIDPPIVSVETQYPGASANIVETRVTQLIEERISGVEGIRTIESKSEDGRSLVTIEFNVGRDVDAAANDIRDRVAGVLSDLPTEADPPEIAKVDGDQDVIMWLNLASPEMTVPELTDYAERYLVDRFSVLDGVARVQIGGQQTYAMRIWLDRNAMAARNLTASDVEAALRSENVELPAGAIESRDRQFTVRIERSFRSAEDFAALVLRRGDEGYLVRLGDVARVEKGTEEERTLFRGNGVPMVGIGIIKQSTANTIAVARAAKAEAETLNSSLPRGMQFLQSYDSSVFVEGAIDAVYKTIVEAIILVVVVIFAFLGSLRATIVPAVAVPVSIMATFIVLYALNFSVNLLTLLALVLAIGIVVDDAIVVLENIVRRIREEKETPLLAAYNGTRQVGFAVIATTAVLIAVFTPIAFLEGDIGRLFSEFALTMAAAVFFSAFVALSLSPMIASIVLKASDQPTATERAVDWVFSGVKAAFRVVLVASLKARWVVVVAFFGLIGAVVWVFEQVPAEYAPTEDRGAFFIQINGPEGATFSYMQPYMEEIERRLMPYTETGEIQRLIVRAPRTAGGVDTFNSGIAVAVMDDWSKRRSGFVVMEEIRKKLEDLPGVRVSLLMRQGFGRRIAKPVQVTIGGGTWEELAAWRDILVKDLNENNPGLLAIDWDYKETQPQLRVDIDYDRAAELGVTVGNIGQTLQTMFGSRRVTTYTEAGEEYDIILEGERDTQRTPDSLQNIYVRSARTNQLIPLANFVTVREEAGSVSLNRYNRIRAITIEANLAPTLALGDALEHIEKVIRDKLPPTVVIDYKGQSLDFRNAGDSMLFVFLLGLVVVFLVLAAQFESWVHPFVIILCVPLAIGGGVVGLWLAGSTINIYSQIALVMLVGLAAKNGILIVEFANQLRDEGKSFDDALLEAAMVRLRPILMTSVTAAAGAVPLIYTSGAGAETRIVIGIVVLAGVLASMVLTMLVVPVAYSLLARKTGSPGEVARRLAADARKRGQRIDGGTDGHAPVPVPGE